MSKETRFAILVGIIVGLLFIFGIMRTTAADAHYYPNDRIANEPWLMEEVELAKDFWRARLAPNHWPENYCPQGISVMVADSLLDEDGIYAVGRGLPCKTWFRGDLIGRNRARKSRKTWRIKRSELIDECHAVVHEIGHALGLALPRFVSPNGAYFDTEDHQWHNGYPMYDSERKWVGTWRDMHPDKGVMSNMHPVTPWDCKMFGREKVQRPRKRR